MAGKIRKKLYLILLILTALIVLTTSSVLAYLYLKRVISLEPVTIHIYGNLNEKGCNLQVCGLTPLGRPKIFQQIMPCCEWYSYYSFFSAIRIEAGSHFLENIDSISVRTGGRKMIFGKSEILTTWLTETGSSNESKLLTLPARIFPQNSVLKKLWSVRNWTMVKYMAAAALILVTALLFLLLRKRIKRFFAFSIQLIKKIRTIRRNKTITEFKSARVKKIKPEKKIHHAYINAKRLKPGLAFLKKTIFKRYAPVTILIFLHVACLVLIPASSQKILDAFLGYYLLFAFFTAVSLFFVIIFKILPFKRETLKNIIALLLSFYLALTVSEFALRRSKIMATYMESRGNCTYHSIYEPTSFSPCYLPEPDERRVISTSEYSYTRHTNSIGLSDREHSVAKAAGVCRVIGIGDSFTEGDGTDKDSTWLRFLERGLNCVYPNLEFMNAGICGSDPFYEYKLLRDKLLAFSPDLVLVAINQSDIPDIIVRGGFSRFREDSSVVYEKAPSWEFIYRHLHIFRLVIHKLLGYDDLLLSPRERKQKESEATDSVKNVLTCFRDLSLANNFKLVIITHPMKNEIMNRKYDYFGSLPLFCSKNSIDYIDLLGFFISQLKVENCKVESVFWKYDGHHNAEGYRIFALGVRDYLLKMKLLE